MATVHFYEKPGCLSHVEQKRLLTYSGHELIVYDLIRYPWADHTEKLRSFFGDLPITDWFNPNAPEIKNVTVIPATLSEKQTIELMVRKPLLIRRPLLEIEGRRFVGFDEAQLLQWLNGTIGQDLESCRNHLKQPACRP